MVLSDKVLILGGFGVGITDSSEFLTIGSTEWQPGPDIPGEYGAHSSCAVALPDDNFVVIGGNNGDGKQVIKYDGSSWSTWTDLNDKRAGHDCALYGSVIVVVGGKDGGKYHASSVMINIADGSNEPGPDMAEARYYFVFYNLNGELIAAGGDNGETNLDNAEIFDTTTGGALTGTNMKTVRSYLNEAVVVPESVIKSIIGCA